MLKTVKVPESFEPFFSAAQERVAQYFQMKTEDPSKGTIDVDGQRYILVRGASLSVDLFEIMKERYKDAGEQEAIDVARSFLFDIAHSIGKMDARLFHKKMGLDNPMDRLSAGPVHFAHAGWAFVDISAESRPSPDENFRIIYDHPYSFESDAWIRAGKKPNFAVCAMNAGYSSGWCEESFGVPLVATEILCKARGDHACRFIMAHPSRMEQAVQEYLQKHPETAREVRNYQIPDLGKRKRVENALQAAREENRKLAAVASRTHSSVILMTPAGRIDWVNEGFTRLNEFTLDQVKGQAISDFLERGRTEGEIVEWIQACIRDRQASHRETERHAPSGKRLWLDVEIQPIVNDAGELTSVVAIETDITERKEYEERQVSLLRDLEKANKELNDFAYIVSHDLKAPLRGIKTLVTWIAEDCSNTLTSDSRQQMDLLNGRVDRMHKLIEGVLQYSRAGRAEEEVVQIDLNQALAEVVDLLAPPDPIAITIPEPLPTIVGDRIRIQQVFQNLLSNAIKYMDKPEGRIAITFSEHDDNWQFNVTDNGPGIEEKYFELIFGMFKTLNPRDSFESTGVGLTVVKKIVEHCGGRIWVDSKVGEGTTFSFTLAKRTLDGVASASQTTIPATAEPQVAVTASCE
jgi:PAS domain S-box-containing protein